MDPDLDADDPYDVLGLSRDATDAEAEDRARRLLDEYSDDHDARMALNAAFEKIQQRPSPVEVGDTTVVPLVVSATPDTISAGEEVTVRVTDFGDAPVSGARIRCQDGSRARTDDDGQATLRIHDVGITKVVAEKRYPDSGREYRDGTVEVRVEES